MKYLKLSKNILSIPPRGASPGPKLGHPSGPKLHPALGAPHNSQKVFAGVRPLTFLTRKINFALVFPLFL